MLFSVAQSDTSSEVKQRLPFINQSPATRVATLATTALLKEIYLTPKPGLVDRHNSGAHNDMDFQTFIVSIQAISKWFDNFYYCGYLHKELEGSSLLNVIRPLGIACEKAMFEATRGINTHKGAIFSLGLICVAVGHLEARREQVSHVTICNRVAAICQNILNELVTSNRQKTAGERLYKLYGFTGARGEAAAGFTTVIQYSLPIYIALLRQGHSEQTALLQALMALMAHNNDTNVVARGGLEGLTFVQETAQKLLDQYGLFLPEDLTPLFTFDQQLIDKHLSPGGSADLLSITWFLAQYEADNLKLC